MKRVAFTTELPEQEFTEEEFIKFSSEHNSMQIQRSLKIVFEYLGISDVDISINIAENHLENEDVFNIFTLCEPYDTELTPSIIIKITNKHKLVTEEVALIFNMLHSSVLPKFTREFSKVIQRIIDKQCLSKCWSLHSDITYMLLTFCFDNNYFPRLANTEIISHYIYALAHDNDDLTKTQQIECISKVASHYSSTKVSQRADFEIVDLYMASGLYEKALALLTSKIAAGYSTSSFIANQILNAKLKLKILASVHDLFALGRSNTQFVRDKLDILYMEAEKILKTWTDDNGDFLTYIYDKYKTNARFIYKYKGFEYFAFDQITEVSYFVKNLSREAENILRERENIKKLIIDMKPDSYFQKYPSFSEAYQAELKQKNPLRYNKIHKLIESHDKHIHCIKRTKKD